MLMSMLFLRRIIVRVLSCLCDSGYERSIRHSYVGSRLAYFISGLCCKVTSRLVTYFISGLYCKMTSAAYTLRQNLLHDAYNLCPRENNHGGSAMILAYHAITMQAKMLILMRYFYFILIFFGLLILVQKE